MQLKNVSSPFRTQNSDYDLQAELPSFLFDVVTKFCQTVGIGAMKRDSVYRIELSSTIEVFILPSDHSDMVTFALENNLVTMKNWNTEIKLNYLEEKAKIANLQGKERKMAKAQLALRFGLNPVVYGA